MYNLAVNGKIITQSEIQARIDEAIRQSGKTQQEIAKQLHISQQMVSQYALARKMPALDTFANLCAVLDVDPAYILCLEKY